MCRKQKAYSIIKLHALVDESCSYNKNMFNDNYELLNIKLKTMFEDSQIVKTLLGFAPKTHGSFQISWLNAFQLGEF